MLFKLSAIRGESPAARSKLAAVSYRFAALGDESSPNTGKLSAVVYECPADTYRLPPVIG
jgi:hypothetical protein